MRIVTAPSKYVAFEGAGEHTIFLAGGISNCPNWQEVLTSHLIFGFSHKNFVILNPRRENFDVAKESESVKQIEWEHQMLNICDTVLFWFPPETLCPITLYELGNYTEKKNNLIVGVHENYKRKLDVITQTTLRRNDVKVAVGWDNFLWEVATHLRSVECKEGYLADEVEV